MNRSVLFFLLINLAACHVKEKNFNSWNRYGGNNFNNHYSSLSEIDTTNIALLAPAWTFRTGDADTINSSQIQCNPIIIDSVIYITSPTLKLFALHAGTGKKIWEFDPGEYLKNKRSFQFIINNNRGVTYWSDNKNDKRIFFVAGSYLNCIDAVNGQLIKNFGDSGIVNLHNGLDREVQDLLVIATSPGIIYKDLFILGSRVDEGPAAAPGHIRAFDVRTGEIKWIFHTIPYPGEYGYETWDDPLAYKYVGGANSWSGFSLDNERGILFAPTGSASFDFYGGKRTGKNLFANCLLALDAASGKRIWHYQFVHHDLWDRDIPTSPVLITIKKNDTEVDAVVQATKHGMLWLFNRETGEPLHPINEIPVDTVSQLSGEKVWPTQPIPSYSNPFVRQTFTASDLNPYLPDSSKEKIKKELSGYRYGNMFIPPGRQTSVVFPGFDGGAEWGGPGYDPETGFLYINANEMGWLLTVTENKKETQKEEDYYEAGLRLYQRHCASCHGNDKKGSGNFPSIEHINEKYNSDQLKDFLSTGRRMMPSFNFITTEEKEAIIHYVLNLDDEVVKRSFVRQPQPQDEYRNLPYRMTGYYKFLSPEGYPAIAPPWGTLTAIDLNTGEHIWKITIGEYPELTQKGIPPTGTENYGGPVVTAGGLVFIAASKDGKFRAFNKKSGNLIWEYQLPAAGFATPATYQYKGKQYVVIACGGGKLNAKSGDSYIAFSIPDK